LVLERAYTFFVTLTKGGTMVDDDDMSNYDEGDEVPEEPDDPVEDPIPDAGPDETPPDQPPAML
jgi:hypothetical protein